MQLGSAADRASRAGEQAALQREASLRRIATLVAGGAAPAELFSAVAREVSVVLEVPVVTVGRYELENEAPVSVVLASREHGSFPVGSRWPLDGAGTREIYEDRQPIRIEDFSGLTGTLAQAARKQAMSWVVGAPIIVDGAVWGNIYAGTAEDDPIPEDAESRLADFTDLVSTAIADSDARERMARLLDEQAALRRVATRVAQGVTATELFAAVADEVAEMLGYGTVTVDRYEADGTSTVIAACGPNSFPVGSRWPLDEPSLVAAVLASGSAVRIDDYSALADTIGFEVEEVPFVCAVGVPIVVDGAPWGAICVGTTRVEDMPPDTEGRLAGFTDLVATAIANAQSRGELAASEALARELANEQASLRRVATLVAESASAEKLFSAVAEEVARVLSVPEVTIDRFDEDGSATTVLASWCTTTTWAAGTRWPLDGPSLAATIWETGRPARIDNYTELSGTIAAALRDHPDVRGVGVPIVVGNRVWGMIGAGPLEDDAPEAVQERLARFTELVATAIANSESRAELAASEARARELADEQAALRRVATLVAQGASPDVLFSAVAREVAGVIGIPAVGVHRYEADATFTMVGIIGDTSFTVGSRWPVEEEGLSGIILVTGRPARKDDHATSTVGVPIVVEGTIWGFMVAAVEPGRPIPADMEERLARFTELVATAVSNASTRTELLTSRSRLVSAADETRRRLERDLHDGIQQWLVALALRARKAAGLSHVGESAGREFAGLADDLVAVTDELREISGGIHPAILSDSGLDDALGALARRSAIRVDLDVVFQGRYDATIEATMYYVAAESITNAVKHARASTVTMRGGRRDDAVELEIRDDGVGGADPHRGTGLIGLKDRVDSLGGAISFASPVGAGTTIRVKLPASAPASG